MNDNNKIQANSVDDNKIQANLTELWQKGELPAEWYYVKFDNTDNIYITFYAKSERHFNYCGIHIPEDEITEVLAPVPSYEEYQKLLSDQLAKIEGEEINAELEAENAKLKELLNTIKKQCELRIPKNGLSPVGDRAVLCKLFLDLIDEVIK